MQHRPSFQLGNAYSAQRVNTMSSYHSTRSATKGILKQGKYSSTSVSTSNHIVTPSQKTKSMKNQRKKKSWIKRIFKRKAKVPLWKRNQEIELKRQLDNVAIDNDDDYTVTSPASTIFDSPSKKYFSTTTEGFECILDVNSLSRKLSYQPPKKPKLQSPVQDASSSVSPFDNWESFVSLLTSTNESMKLSLYDASETLKKYFLSEETIFNNISNHDESKKRIDNTIKKGKPMNEVTLNFSEKVPFEEAASQVSGNISVKGSQTKVIIKDKSSMSIASKAEKVENSSSLTSKAATVTRQIVSKAHQDEEDDSKKSDVEYGANVIMPYDVPSQDGPTEEIYDSLFTLSFLRDVSTVGILLTYFKVPNAEEDENDDISSALVNLTIKPGLSRGTKLLEPKLYWTEVTKPTDNVSCRKEEYSISLLSIHSIRTSLNEKDDDDQTQFFTITTEQGDVHVFEAPTILERHNVVNGIKNVCAWLSYHLIMGNMASGTELVSDMDEEHGDLSGELPSLRTPTQAMNVLSHTFLD